PNNVVDDERALAPGVPAVAVRAADPQRSLVAVDALDAGQDRVVDDLDETRDTVGAPGADDHRHPGPIAGEAQVGPDEDVVHDQDLVDWTGEVQLGATVLVDAEVVVLDSEPPPGAQLDRVLVAAAVTAEEPEAARQRALEPVSADREIGSEPPVDEVAPVAVVKPVVLNRDVASPPSGHEGVPNAR